MDLHHFAQHAPPWQGQPGHLLTHRATSGGMQARHATSTPKVGRPCRNDESQKMGLREAGAHKSKQSKADLDDSQRRANGQQRLQKTAPRVLVKRSEMQVQGPRGQVTAEFVASKMP